MTPRLALLGTALLAPLPGIATDKAAHFGLAAVTTETTLKVCQWHDSAHTISLPCRWAAAGAVMALGVAKELADQRGGGRVDAGDLAADVLGIATGQLLQWEF